MISAMCLLNIRFAGRRSMFMVACAVLIAAASHCGTAAAAPVREQRLCSVHRCTTLVANSNIRVFRATAKHPNRESYESTFAEWLPSGRVTALAGEGGFGEGSVRIGPVVSGRFVAYAVLVEVARYAGAGFGEDVRRLNAQTGRREGTPAHGKKGTVFPGASLGVTQVVVTPAGSVAWMIEGPFGDPEAPERDEPFPNSTAILLLPVGATASTVLAYGPTIEPMSLAAIPGHLYWIEGGVARTASIQ